MEQAHPSGIRWARVFRVDSQRAQPRGKVFGASALLLGMEALLFRVESFLLGLALGRQGALPLAVGASAGLHEIGIGLSLHSTDRSALEIKTTPLGSGKR